MAKDFYMKLDTKARIAKKTYMTYEDIGFLDIVECQCHEFGGYLSPDGEVPSEEDEATMVGAAVDLFKHLLDRLLKFGVLARDERGLIYSPELLQELELREKRRRAGQAGGRGRGRKQTTKQNVTMDMAIDSDYDSQSSGSDSGFGGPGGEDLHPFGELTDEYQLSCLLRSLILQNNHRARVPDEDTDSLIQWSNEMNELMARYDVEEIKEVIRWCQEDDHWRSIVLSPRKLVEHFDSLFLRAENDAI